MRSSRAASPLRATRLELAQGRRALAVVARGLADQRRLARREARQAGVEDQVARVLVVVVVVDGDADVVQHRRRPHQLALLRVAVVQAGRGQRVPHLQREPGDVLGVREVGVVLGGEVAHGVAADVARPAAVAEQRSKNTPSRRPASVASNASKPPASITPSMTSAPARIRSPREALIPGTSPRSAAVMSANSLDQLAERLARDAVALDAVGRQPGRELRRGGEVADRAADRRPAARRRPATRRSRAPARRARAAPSSASSLPRSAKRSVMRTAPSGHERTSAASRSSTRVSCIEPPPRSSTTPSDSVVELTAAR